MIITKVIETALNIKNCIDTCADLEPNLMRILKDKFENRCNRGCFIKKVVRIIKMGECRINQDGAPSFGVIPVSFEVSAIIYYPGEIINGCTVVNHAKNGTLVCSTENADIIIMPMQEFSSVSKGQIISIRVGATRYNINSLKISISAVFFSPIREVKIYKLNGAPKQDASFNDVLARISAEEAAISGLKGSKPWEVFSQLLYAYRTPQKTPAGAKVVKLMDFPSNGYIVRDLRLDLAEPTAYVYEDLPAGRLDDSLQPNQVMLLMLEDYYSIIRTIREMIEIYSTEQRLNDHNNLWRIYKKLKLD